MDSKKIVNHETNRVEPNGSSTSLQKMSIHTGNNPQLRTSGISKTRILKTDRFGFLIGDQNDDSNSLSSCSEGEKERLLMRNTNRGYRPAGLFIGRTERKKRSNLEWSREKKWIRMMRKWERVSDKKKTRKRIKKGIPDSMRAFAWMDFGQACNIGEKDYQWYVDAAEMEQSKSILDTIERDITRTFPRHVLFLELEPDDSDDDEISQDMISGKASQNGFSTLCSSDIVEAEKVLSAAIHCQINTVLEEDDDIVCESNGALDNEKLKIKEATGQTLLRRVLRAYSIFDKKVGYCQGMGFVAAMFLTYMPEEEAFHQLVAVMNDEPCMLRDLYEEGMVGARKVLFVAEKMMMKFLPALHDHFEKENIFLSMFATQWLITVYTSNFPFDLVTRVWDTFLVSGWKIVYKVMLALLKNSSKILLMMRFESILAYLRRLPSYVDGKQIMDLANSIPIRRKDIAKAVEDFNANN
mmetsp:Transcript_22761/g.29171  ORF Transcript_22761/g.29171 Transcript_22761/m.29171 type:complete len:468 (-) Transcript_22761:85-1488(-)